MPHYNHPWQGHRLCVPVKNPIGVCPNCGVTFRRTHNKQIQCTRACKHKPTPAEKLIMERFRATCKKYRLSAASAFSTLAHKSWKEYVQLESPEKCNLIHGKQKRDRLLMLLKKFCDDMEKGMYDLYPKHHQTGWYEKIVTAYHPFRRKTPLERRCPKNVPNCAGGFYPGDCPRHWRECEFAA